jgi:hypothetical protein
MDWNLMGSHGDGGTIESSWSTEDEGGRGPIVVISRHFPGGNKENQENLDHDSLYPAKIFESSTSKIQVRDVAACANLILQLLCRLQPTTTHLNHTQKTTVLPVTAVVCDLYSVGMRFES